MPPLPPPTHRWLKLRGDTVRIMLFEPQMNNSNKKREKKKFLIDDSHCQLQRYVGADPYCRCYWRSVWCTWPERPSPWRFTRRTARPRPAWGSTRDRCPLCPCTFATPPLASWKIWVSVGSTVIWYGYDKSGYLECLTHTGPKHLNIL